MARARARERERERERVGVLRTREVECHVCVCVCVCVCVYARILPYTSSIRQHTCTHPSVQFLCITGEGKPVSLQNNFVSETSSFEKALIKSRESGF
jgi:hypothetical protein